MYEAIPYGHLLVNGSPPTDTQLAALAGAPSDQVPALIRELESAGVFSKTKEGVIFSRRMTRDQKRNSIAAKNGRKGGEKSLLLGKVPGVGVEQNIEQDTEPQKPKAIFQKEPSLQDGAATADASPNENQVLARQWCWTEGVKFLKERGGMGEKWARGFVARCKDKTGEDYIAVKLAFDRAAGKQTGDPQAYIMAILTVKETKDTAAPANPGEWRDGKIWLTPQETPQQYEAWREYCRKAGKFIPANGAFMPSEYPPSYSQTVDPRETNPERDQNPINPPNSIQMIPGGNAENSHSNLHRYDADDFRVNPKKLGRG